MTTTMTIQDDEWTTAGMEELWADDGDSRAGQFADTQYAWIINHAHEYLPSGWHFYDNGSFGGPPSVDAYQIVLNIITESVDYVVGCIEDGEFDEELADA